MDPSLNVFDGPLESCCKDPITGFYRDGSCNTSPQDRGLHTVCVKLTDEFLQFSKARGNDLSTPHPEWNFPGLKEGDKWCLCALRWLEAHQESKAPKVYLRATHKKTLESVPLSILKDYALDLA